MSEGLHRKYDFSPLLLSLFGILCGAALVAAFHCVAMGWCSRRRARSPIQTQVARPSHEVSTPSTSGSCSAQLLNVYVYSKEWKEATCAVCLSEFVEGEEVRILPDCAHAFHVPCIDMWLYSHPNCPLCRTSIVAMETHVVMSLPSSGELPPPIESLPNSGELPPPVEPLPSSGELMHPIESVPSSAGLPSPVHNQFSNFDG